MVATLLSGPSRSLKCHSASPKLNLATALSRCKKNPADALLDAAEDTHGAAGWPPTEHGAAGPSLLHSGGDPCSKAGE